MSRKRKLEFDVSLLKLLPRKRMTGFSLVEVMVALVIGMFGVLVMMQVLSVSEEQKRTTTGGNDALNEGVMALYAVQNDIRSSGYGIVDMNLLGCSVVLRFTSASDNLVLAALAPVTINPQRLNWQTGALSPLMTGDANTDTLLVVYGTNQVMPQGDSVQNVQAGTGTWAGGNDGIVQTPTQFSTNDYVIAVPKNRATNCNNLILSKVAAKASVYPSNMTLVYQDQSLNRVAFNPAAVAPQLVNPVVAGGRFYNLGFGLRVIGYAVRGGNLTTCDFGLLDCTAAVNWSSIANNVVSMRAQYVRDGALAGAMDGVAERFDQFSPNIYPQNSATTYVPPTPWVNLTTSSAACEWAKISAVRLAVVARSAQMEKTAVTAAAPSWPGAGTTIDVSASNASWNNYRYKVFQATVPIRNIAMQGIFQNAAGASC